VSHREAPERGIGSWMIQQQVVPSVSKSKMSAKPALLEFCVCQGGKFIDILTSEFVV